MELSHQESTDQKIALAARWKKDWRGTDHRRETRQEASTCSLGAGVPLILSSIQGWVQKEIHTTGPYNVELTELQGGAGDVGKEKSMMLMFPENG